MVFFLRLVYTQGMLRKKFVARLGLYMLVVFTLHETATFLHWYSLVWWFDMPMHFLGGATVFYLSAVLILPALNYVPSWRFVMECILLGLLIGVSWEAFELYMYLHFGSPDFILLDSLSDVCFDIAGLCFAALTALPLFAAFGAGETAPTDV